MVEFLPKEDGLSRWISQQSWCIFDTSTLNIYGAYLKNPYNSVVLTGYGGNNCYIVNGTTIRIYDTLIEDNNSFVYQTPNVDIKRVTFKNGGTMFRVQGASTAVVQDLTITKASNAFLYISGWDISGIPTGIMKVRNLTTAPGSHAGGAADIQFSSGGTNPSTLDLINSSRRDYTTTFQADANFGTLSYIYEADVNVKNTSGTNLSGVKIGFWDALNANNVWLTTDAGGNIAQQQLLNSRIYRNTLGQAIAGITEAKTPHKFKVMSYAYNYFNVSKDVSKQFADGIVLSADPYVTLSESAANALTGISINWSTKVITVSGTRTLNELYDYCKAQNVASVGNAFYDQPLLTTDGVNFALNGFTMTITGSVTGLTEVLTGTKTISTGGFFEDRTGAIKNISGTLHYGSRIGYNIKALTGGANIAGAIVAHIDASGNDRTYNTSWTNGALTTDASGNVEGYAVWKVGATEYTSHNLQVGEYNYNWLSIPKTVTGSAINETQRLVTDSQVTLTKANALLVSGIAVTAGSTNIDLSDELLSPAYDNLKARQAAVATIEAGVKGYMNYYSYGLLISKDGTTFTLKDGWDFDNWSTIETGTFRGGQLNFDTADTYSLNFYDNDFNFTTAGTYDFRNATTTGTITLDQTGDVAITAQFHPDATLVNNDETYITVEASVAIQILINGMTAGSRYQVYDVTNDTELENGVTVTGAEDLNYTYSTPTTVRLRVMYVDGLNADEWVEVTGLTSATGLSFNVNPEADLVYEANAVNGSTVTECSVSGATILIYLDDPDGLTSWQRIYAWYRYYLSTEAGIREQNGAYITMPTQTLIQFDTNVLQINNQSASPLIISGANIITDSGDINDAFDYAGSTGSINNNPDIVVPFVYASETVNVWNEPPTAVQIRQEVDTNSTKLASILEDTGTSLPADIAGVTGGLTVEENAKLMGLKNANLLVGKKIL
jgi:hypothetical protein